MNLPIYLFPSHFTSLEIITTEIPKLHSIFLFHSSSPQFSCFPQFIRQFCSKIYWKHTKIYWNKQFTVLGCYFYYYNLEKKYKLIEMVCRTTRTKSWLKLVMWLLLFILFLRHFGGLQGCRRFIMAILQNLLLFNGVQDSRKKRNLIMKAKKNFESRNT